MYVNKQSSKKLQETLCTSFTGFVSCSLSQYGGTPLWYMDRMHREKIISKNPEAMKIKELLLSKGAKSEPVCTVYM